MGYKVVCPNCHKINDSDSEICDFCGHSLGYNNIMHNEAESNYDYNYKKHSYRFLFIIILAFLTAAFSIVGFLLARESTRTFILSCFVSQKITGVRDKTIYINQNDKYSLPSEVTAKQNYGENKSVSIKWQPDDIDTSTPGTKTAFGKVDGYNSKVKYTITVLPDKVMHSFEDCTVEGSIVDFDVKVDKEIKWIMIEVMIGNGDFDMFTFKAEDGLTRFRLYLPFGPGNYTLSISINKNGVREGGYDSLKSINVSNIDKRNMNYLMPESDIQSDSPEIIKLADDITKNCYSDTEKALAIHDWVAEHIAYDTIQLKYPNHHEYTALETYKGRKAASNGYANLTAALNRAADIRTKIAYGDEKGDSAWDEVYIDGKWITEDTFRDAGYVDKKSQKFIFRLTHLYFNP